MAEQVARVRSITVNLVQNEYELVKEMLGDRPAETLVAIAQQVKESGKYEPAK